MYFAETAPVRLREKYFPRSWRLGMVVSATIVWFYTFHLVIGKV